jgi:hypothetical protein
MSAFKGASSLPWGGGISLTTASSTSRMPNALLGADHLAHFAYQANDAFDLCSLMRSVWRWEGQSC